MTTSPYTPAPTPTLLLLLVTQFHSTTSIHIPFGYQSDSSLSAEYTNVGNPLENTPVDPSTYAGSIHYDSLHHALYITGATFASDIFDGSDFYQIQKEKDESSTNNDPSYGGDGGGPWWLDMKTGLNPHMGDLGIPSYSPLDTGDCFYAVMGLPLEDDNDGSGSGAIKNNVKMMHSRRFGSESASYACSAVDILFASPKSSAPGGYIHEFETLKGENTVPPAISPGNVLPSSVTGVDDLDTGFPTFTPTASPAGDSDSAPSPTNNDGGESPTAQNASSPSAEPSSSTYVPTMNPTMTSEPTSSTFMPTITAEPSSSTYIPTETPTSSPIDGTNGRRALQTDPTSEIEDENEQHLLTRSVRLLMAGHFIATKSSDDDGYLIKDLPAGQYNEASVYAFAQQVDVRLPIGSLAMINEGDQSSGGGDGDDAKKLDQYDLYNQAEEDMSSKLPWNQDPEAIGALLNSTKMQELYGDIVTSGVESRALLNDELPRELDSMYPVSLVADPLSKKHYYVVLLASDKTNVNNNKDKSNLHTDTTIGAGASQKSRTDYPDSIADARMNGDFFGEKGRPDYGSNYRIIVKKVSIESIDPTCNVDTCELTATEVALASMSYENEKIAMRHEWSEQYAPDFGEDARPAGMLYVPSGDESGKGDILVMAGTTSGMGSAFGTNMDQAALLSQDGAAPKRYDLDGFLMKINTESGAFVGHDKFDPVTSSFTNMHSHRIESLPNKDDIVTGLCAEPLRQVGVQGKMRYIYVVGSTSGELPALVSRDDFFLNTLADQEGSDGMEAFLFKIDLDTMNPVWTVQIGAVYPKVNMKGDAFGYGCAVAPDGQEVYLTGIVKGSTVATDFSSSDIGDLKANGGTDIFVASYDTQDGSRNFLRQVGSTRDDFPSRGNGGITTDRFGNAVLTGNTRGSLMRKRDPSEYKYGHSSNVAASDLFVMSFERKTGVHVDIFDDGVPPLVHNIVPPPTPVNPAPFPAPFPETLPSPAQSSDGEITENKGATIFGTVALSLLVATSFIAMVGVMLRARRKSQRKNENNKDINLVGKRKSAWNHPVIEKFEDMDIMVEVRASASGGWHGVYELPEDGTGVIDFGVTTPTSIPDQSLFAMEDGLEEIENSHHNVSIDEFDDISEQDLIDAYNDAIEDDYDFDPGSADDDVQFAMPSMGSSSNVDDDDDHHLII